MNKYEQFKLARAKKWNEMTLKRDLKLDIDPERMQEIWRDAVDLEPIQGGHKAIAEPPDVPLRVSSEEEAPPNPASLRVVTIPNAISLMRLLLVPLLVWLIVSRRDFSAALIVLVVIGVSDWADGKIARFWHVESKVGAYLDPAADRLLTVCVPIAMAIIGFFPWWVVGVVVFRDVFLTLLIPIYERRGIRMSVIYLGKVATASLMVAFPIILLANVDVTWNGWLEPLSWAILLWAVTLYTWTGVLYTYRAYLLWKTVPVLSPEEKKQWAESKKILS